ncbi:unnamed protein product [Soboliphyme baturini]|uniref:Adenosine 3'-phospho 5'-phosphosulfate transporter 1 n=1 Tax=Soboliphyme baturini TaxID=241478 RepID=A0A183IUD6_9BILA|nr:unnamed protein product [Soboliphyme baturini]
MCCSVRFRKSAGLASRGGDACAPAEKIMTTDYVRESTSIGGDEASNAVRERFTDSQFLVFANRFVALVLSSCVMCCRRPDERLAPLYKFSYASLSNILSSWCQYEALKFITFPTQVLCKASKVLPVMVMGRFIQHKTYSARQYVSALLITMVTSDATTVSGVILMIGYLTFDSFTANWQSALFRNYRISTVQMMFGVNAFSFVLTLVTLVQQNSLSASVAFFSRHSSFGLDVLATSVASAVGQLFIFYTVSEFGAVTFTIIMAVRQALSIFLSCLIYRHRIAVRGIAGIIIVFCSIFLRIYWNRSRRRTGTAVSLQKT